MYGKEEYILQNKNAPVFRADKDSMRTLGDLAFRFTFSVLNEPQNYDCNIVAALPDFIRLFGDTSNFSELP